MFEAFFNNLDNKDLARLQAYKELLKYATADQTVATNEIGCLLQIMLTMYLYLNILENVCKVHKHIITHLKQLLDERMHYITHLIQQHGDHSGF